MAFPVTQLPLYAGIAPGADPANPATWSFTDVTTDVREYGQVQIQVGRQDEGSVVDATRAAATFNNPTGNYVRVNPVGQWYGQLDKGTPVEYRVTRINDTFTRTSASGLGTDADSGLTWTGNTVYNVSGNAAQAPLAAANSIMSTQLLDAAADDVEVSTVASLSVVATGAHWVHGIQLRWADTDNYYRMHTEFGLSGVVSVKIVKRLAAAEVNITSLTTTSVTYTAGQKIRTRARAVGATLQIRVWQDGQPEPSTWQLTATDDDITGQAVGLYQWRIAGNTNPGSVTCTIDDFRMDAIRASTPVPEWPVRWDQSGKDVTAPITGAGILRRLAQGSSALRSPIYRQLLAQPGCGYWPLEDGAGATSAASTASARVPPATVLDGTFGNTDCPPGAASALTLNTAFSSKLTGRITQWTVPQDGYAAMAYMRLGSVAGVGEVDLFEINTKGTVTRWMIRITTTTFTLTGFDPIGAAVVGPTVVGHLLTTTSWFALQLEAQEVGGNVNWSLIWHQVGSDSFLSTSGSYAGTADQITTATVIAPVASTLVSHLWLGDDLLPFVDGTFIAVSAGYAGEAAGARLARLAAQESIPLRIFGDPAKTALMGPQRPATVLELARECEAADQGVLVEAGAGLGYLTHAFRQNPPVAMALDFNAGHIAAPPEPVDDDQRLRNLIKLERFGGSEVTVQNDASIAKSGTYSDELTVNLRADSLLYDHAAWRLSQGTFDDLRWPRIVLQLHRNPSLIASWCKVRVGSRITIANPPSAVGTEGLDLIVEGWTETLGPYSWDVTLACSPAKPWDVGAYGDTTHRRDAGSTILIGPITSTGTSVKIGTSDTPAVTWSTAGVPYDVRVAGEKMTVTAMSAASSDATLIPGTFETTAEFASWGTSSCTWARSSAVAAHGGSFEGLVTVVGSPTLAYPFPLLAASPRVVPGASYTLSVWVRSAVTLTEVRATIDWIDAAGGFISNVDAGGSLTAGSWVQRTVTGTAPAGAVYAQYHPTILASPAAGSLLYVDDLAFTSSTVLYQTATVTRSVNGIVKAQAAGAEWHIATPGRWAL